MTITIREATPNDLLWINQQYESVDFRLSDLKDEDVIIAMIDGQKAGLGRLQKMSETESELGGIYVLPEYRGSGIAKKVVTELLKIGQKFHRIYCLPFPHLNDFYESFGFTVMRGCHGVPEKIMEKHNWCNANYHEEVLLYVKHMKQINKD